MKFILICRIHLSIEEKIYKVGSKVQKMHCGICMQCSNVYKEDNIIAIHTAAVFGDKGFSSFAKLNSYLGEKCIIFIQDLVTTVGFPDKLQTSSCTLKMIC